MPSIAQALSDQYRERLAREQIQDYRPRLKTKPKAAITSIPSGAKRVVRVNKKPTRQPVTRVRYRLSKYEQHQTMMALEVAAATPAQREDRKLEIAISEREGKLERRRVDAAMAESGLKE